MCQQDFETIKNYLMNFLFLQPLRSGKLLILYLEIEKEAVGVMLAQEGEEKVEHAVYYLSKKLLPLQSSGENMSGCDLGNKEAPTLFPIL